MWQIRSRAKVVIGVSKVGPSCFDGQNDYLISYLPYWSVAATQYAQKTRLISTLGADNYGVACHIMRYRTGQAGGDKPLSPSELQIVRDAGTVALGAWTPLYWAYLEDLGQWDARVPETYRYDAHVSIDGVAWDAYDLYHALISGVFPRAVPRRFKKSTWPIGQLYNYNGGKPYHVGSIGVDA